MTRIVTLFFLLFSALMVSAQTAADCDAASASPILSLLAEIQADQPYNLGTNETYCADSDVPFFSGPIGMVSITSADPVPFTINVTDKTTGAVTVLMDSGDAFSVVDPTIYFVEIVPTAVGAGEVTLTPSIPGANTETVIITVEEVLPVSWSSPLAYTTVKNDHTFSWGISQQENVAAYELQTSSDSRFETIAITSPKPYYGSELLYEIETHARARNAYYRIRQVDFDGRESYGNVVFVPGQSLSDGINVYPNPAANQLWIQGLSTAGSGRLLSANGQVVRTYAQVQDGGVLDVSGLKNGIYTLQVVGTDKGSSVTRVVLR